MVVFFVSIVANLSVRPEISRFSWVEVDSEKLVCISLKILAAMLIIGENFLVVLSDVGLPLSFCQLFVFDSEYAVLSVQLDKKRFKKGIFSSILDQSMFTSGKVVS